MTGSGRSYPLTKGLTGLNRASASSSKADVQNVGIGVELNVRLWPKAAVDEAKSHDSKRITGPNRTRRIDAN